MRSVCEQHDAELQKFNGRANHVHLLVLYPPTVQISNLVNLLKGQASRLLRQEFASHLKRYLWGEHLWSPSYFAGSVGGAPISVPKAYIENQQRPGYVSAPIPPRPKEAGGSRRVAERCQTTLQFRRWVDLCQSATGAPRGERSDRSVEQEDHGVIVKAVHHLGSSVQRPWLVMVAVILTRSLRTNHAGGDGQKTLFAASPRP